MTPDDSRRLIQHETSSQEVVPQNRDMQGHREASGASLEDDHAAGARGHFVHAIRFVDSRSPKITEANDKSEISGAGPVPLRGMQGFANQENVRPRNPPSSTNRLPNGKLGACHRLQVTETVDHELTQPRCRKWFWLGCLRHATGRRTRLANYATTKHGRERWNGIIRAKHRRVSTCNSSRPLVSHAPAPQSRAERTVEGRTSPYVN